MKALIFAVLAGMGFSASADTLTYVVDLGKMAERGHDVTSLDICGFDLQFTMDAADPIGPTFINQYFYGEVTQRRIQNTTGAISGGGLEPEYSGDYREKVYIVDQVIEGAYEPAIVSRVQVNTYGSTAAPSGMIVNVQLLNHHYSAELAEGSNCGDIYYKLVQ